MIQLKRPKKLINDELIKKPEQNKTKETAGIERKNANTVRISYQEMCTERKKTSIGSIYGRGSKFQKPKLHILLKEKG